MSSNHYKKYKETIKEVTKRNYRKRVSSLNQYLENTNYKDGTDLADVLINENLYKNSETKEIKQEKEDPSPATINTITEVVVKKMASKNAKILKLINVFQLSDSNGIEIRI